MNDKKFTTGVIFDIKKPFDVCSHDSFLIKKLSKMDITGTAYEWSKLLTYFTIHFFVYILYIARFMYCTLILPISSTLSIAISENGQAGDKGDLGP